MLKPLLYSSLPYVLSFLFTICWQWSYVPSAWRHAAVFPILKKGDPLLPSNYRPISLTSVLRKLLELCIAPSLDTYAPPLDLAQGGFRPQRSALDQTLCLHELMHEYFRRHHHFPFVAFLDIKAAYDTVDRQVIWQALASTSMPTPLLSLLAHLFDDVSISVLIQNHTSASFFPSTGVLQGSVLSPHLYSIYINSLPSVLRTVASPDRSISLPDPSSTSLTPPLLPINSLLYADDVAIFGSPSDVRSMLQIAETHSLTLGYRWNPSKCAIIMPPTSPQRFHLYGTEIPMVEEFIYLGLPFLRSGLSTAALIQHHSSCTMLAMSILHAIGAKCTGFSLLLSSRLYTQFVRPIFEYGLAISTFRLKDLQALDKLQDRCLHMIFGGHPTSSTHVLKHITCLPSMKYRATVLTTRFCLRARFLPDDCLLTLISTHLSCNCFPTLKRTPLYTALPDPLPSLRLYFRTAHQESLTTFLSNAPITSQVLLRACRPQIGIDPILYVPATRMERSRLIRWRMGWLPGKPKPCSCLQDHTSRRHFPFCPAIPSQLWDALPPLSATATHPIDNAISLLPLSRSASCPPYWPALLTLLWHIECLCNPDGDYSSEPDPGVLWLPAPSLPAEPG